MGFLGLFPFSAPYLPWVLLLFSMFIGNPIETDLLGIVVGHVYYFLEFVYPHVARVRGWRRQKLLVTPRLLHLVCGTTREGEGGVAGHQVRQAFRMIEGVTGRNGRWIGCRLCNVLVLTWLRNEVMNG
jgi:hypothetical protein